MDRIHQLTMAQTPSRPRSADAPAEPTVDPATGGRSGEWMPIEPETLAAAGLTDGEIEALALKTLNGRAEATGRICPIT